MKKRKEDDTVQLTMSFEEEKENDFLNEKLKEIDPLRLTPIEALNLLYELKSEMDNSKK